MNQDTIHHWLALRRMLIHCVGLYALVATPLIIWAGPLYSWLATPLLMSLPKGGQIVATSITSPFLTPLKLALMTSVFLALPVLVWRIWRFLAPALYQSEKQKIAPMVCFSIGLFYLGAAFAFYVVGPMAIRFFYAMAPEGVGIMTDIHHYLSFMSTLLLAFGVTFQVPIVTVILIRAQWVQLDTLRAKRPYIIVSAFILGMVLTPPDVISQILLAIPLLLLFEVGILLAKLLPPSKSKPAVKKHT